MQHKNSAELIVAMKVEPMIYRTRRQQPRNLEAVIKSINPVIRGWGNYFKDGTVNKLFEELEHSLEAFGQKGVLGMLLSIHFLNLN
jgi:hypothetical protein